MVWYSQCIGSLERKETSANTHKRRECSECPPPPHTPLLFVLKLYTATLTGIASLMPHLCATPSLLVVVFFFFSFVRSKKEVRARPDVCVWMASKEGLRKAIRHALSGMTLERKEVESIRICDVLLGMSRVLDGNVRNVGVYLPLSREREVDIVHAFGPLMGRLGKNLHVPFITEEEEQEDGARVMSFVPYVPGTVLKPHKKHSFLQPENHDLIPPPLLDVIIVPGRAFDVAGGRMGWGGGYYDRYLHSFLEKNQRLPFMIGVAFSVQRVESVPMDEHDIRMDCVLFGDAGSIPNAAGGGSEVH